MPKIRTVGLRPTSIAVPFLRTLFLVGLGALLAAADPTGVTAHAQDELALLPLLSTSQLTSQHILIPFQQSIAEDPASSPMLDWSPEGLVLADIDMDGVQEIVVCNGRTASLYLLGPSSVEVVDTKTSPLWPGFVSLAVGELNGRPGDDIIIFYGPDTLLMLLLRTRRSFGARVDPEGPRAPGGNRRGRHGR